MTYKFDDISTANGLVTIVGRERDTVEGRSYTTEVRIGGSTAVYNLIEKLKIVLTEVSECEEEQISLGRQKLLDRKKQIEAELAEIEKRL